MDRSVMDEEERLDAEPIVRNLRESDLDRLIRIDAAITGRSRSEMYKQRLNRALNDTGVNVSLGAEVDGTLVGAVMGSVQYGEFGLAEPVAVLDTMLVAPDLARRGVGRALLQQLVKNLRALRVEHLRTEVGWDEQELIGFLARSGFQPASRLVLEVGVEDADYRLNRG